MAHTETEEESRLADVDYNDIFSDLRVLVVEDEEDNYLLMNALLSRKVKKLSRHMMAMKRWRSSKIKNMICC
ncbi:MAG: hypothetical protein U5L09_21270 [Bacteroidales bacterium]|nr:hypothetical protein [Bacteroidales bacterium]